MKTNNARGDNFMGIFFNLHSILFIHQVYNEQEFLHEGLTSVIRLVFRFARCEVRVLMLLYICF